ncbi:deoxynucleoside kinase [Spirosoma utsteinense]|uniref:Deoxyadenosine/deoxycytidine kinase n=1 Tax=Spirosoma utsteinense TaxID=2585773 RepID=A0ABR6WCD6_9BACT|nr:deoxynucleoside kinase [Spirosoma utsteinense]MBC3788231.1 deoxyadenosine/deoxycytidine kinase [Spirosoma utsteinense]MBC3794192.1 deoxyadenosine/deoxycytidine kinase [Spirosoma utsteinense]
MHIAITGNIGAGKTTLAAQLATYYGWDVLYEAVEGNPYLADFYDDMPRWAFNLQVYFLNSRFDQVRKIREIRKAHRHVNNYTHAVIQDRTIYEDAAIFARNLRESGSMTERDYETYQTLFENMKSLVRPPDLMIYLRADLPKLRAQIRKRGRLFEQSISDEYLNSLNRLYDEFSAAYREGPLLVLDVNELDYAGRPDDFAEVVRQIDERLVALAGKGN